MSRFLTGLFMLPILALSVFAGHELGYRLAYPDPGSRAHELQATGHGYYAYGECFVAVAIAIAVLALGLRVRQAFIGRRRRPPSAAVVALAPLAYLTLEALERLRLGELPGASLASREIAFGLALQIPFALIALLVARVLASVADAIGSGLRKSAAPRVLVRRPILFPAAEDVRRVRVAALAWGVRGPPSFSV